MTPPLTLLVATTALADAALIGDDALAAAVGHPVAPGWAGFPEALPALRDAAPAEPPPDGEPHWSSFLFVAGEPATVVGMGGFHGPPADDVVEVGYAVAPDHQGRGLATEAVRQLVDRATAAGLTAVQAHTLAEENASVAVLRRLGFTLEATAVDPDEGEIWRWRRYLGRTST